MNLTSNNASNSDTQCQEIRELVSRAAGVIAHYWPMPTFVHHNPLHSLESLHFEEAVRLGRRFVGGTGYLPNETFREYYRSGRIRPEHLEASLRTRSQDQHVSLNERTVSHFDVLRAHLLCEPIMLGPRTQMRPYGKHILNGTLTKHDDKSA